MSGTSEEDNLLRWGGDVGEGGGVGGLGINVVDAHHPKCNADDLGYADTLAEQGEEEKLLRWS